ncbi:HAD family hydrolase [Brevirhabdus sp.]|uniref:HAD family hydrolase n=1 Tax=Brevirhabdus sp. TaxID=2004514 RepID=UPI0040590BD2
MHDGRTRDVNGTAGIIFDKDGTLFHFGASWNAWAAGVLDELAGGDAARRQSLAEVLGYDLSAAAFHPGSPAIAGTLAQVATLLAPLVPGSTRQSLATYLSQAAATTPMVEAVPLRATLDGLRAAGLILGVVTNDSDAAARAHLERAGISECFAFVCGCDTGHGAKPDCGQLLAFCDATGLEPARVVMVGDSLHDLAAGRAAGMRSVAVLTGPARVRDLAPAADAVLPDIAHLLDWLRDGRGVVA